MHRSISGRRLFSLSFPVLRSLIQRSAILLLIVRAGPALAQGVVVPGEDVSPVRADATASSALHIVNELSNRRRLTTFFGNEQSPFYGVQINYVNVGRGNLTFLNRDLVRLDRVPIVAGRIYDSQLEAESDFGGGWKLSVSEMIRHRGNALRYIDASGAVYDLLLQGTTIVSRYPHLTGINGGRHAAGEIEIRTPQFTKHFANIGGDFYLSTVTDRFGNSLSLEYSGTRVTRIVSQNGRYVEIERDATARIAAIRDDAGRSVEYEYDSAGRLVVVRGIGGAQWQYRYDANGHLQAATDPRGIDALTASHAQDGRVNDVRVLYDVMSFSYQGSATVVRNGLQQAATFWHRESGLTNTIQDFEGSTTQVEFDSSLRPSSLSFNGAVVAALQYAENGKLQGVRSSLEGRPRITRFSYDGAGRLAAVVADSQRIARYTYDSAGRVLRADDAAGLRSYEYFGATGHQIRFGETELDVETNSLGLMASFSNGHQSVGISYNVFDQVSELQYAEYGDVYEVAYDYGASGLRSAGSYVIAEEQPAPASLSLDYDVVGNLTSLSVEAPTGARSSQTYVLGENNQLTRLMNPRRPDAVFEYDLAGRPTRRTLGTNDVRYGYDSLGRIVSVNEQNRKILEWRYGPMDVDAATEADDHTPWTTVNEPIASAIFGSAESIAYARTRGMPFGPIRFNAAMARFVLPAQLIPSVDSVVLVSLKRRNVPLSADHHASVSPAPLGFDKPSNALFLPPEFSSLNCYYCVAWIVGGGTPSMTINGSSGTPVVPLGTQETISVTGSGQCWSDVFYHDPEGNPQSYTELGTFLHTFDFDNGYYTSFAGDGADPDFAIYYTHPAPGLYTVTDVIGCGCAGGAIIDDWMGQASRNVFVYIPIQSVSVTTPTNQNWYIANSVTMPPVQFAAAINPSGVPVAATTFHWYMEIRYTGVNNNKNFMNRFPPSGTVNITGSNVWQPAWGGFLRGGNEVTVYVAGTYNGTTTSFSSKPGFQIRGENPTQAQMFAIATRTEDKAVMWQESSHRQFNAVRHTGIDFPLFGAPDGWGLMQRDPLQSQDQLWNWQTALNEGVVYLSAVRADAQNYLNFWYNTAANTGDPADDWSWNPATQFPDRVWDDGFSRYNTGGSIYTPNGNQGNTNCAANGAGCAYASVVRGHINSPPW